MADKRIERVFILGMDGAGNFNRQASTPVLDAFAARGAFTNDAQAESPTISAQCWGSALHGVKPEKHGLTNEISASERYPDASPYPSVFKLAREAWPEAKLASFTGWSPINFGIVEDDIGVYKKSLPDRQLVDELCAYVENNPDVKLLFLQLDEPDGSGHRHGYGLESPAYLDAIATCDRLFGEVLQTIEKAGILDTSLIIALTDHGGGGDDPFNHGSDHPMDKNVFWGCFGPGIEPGTPISALSLADTAAVAAWALGLEAPSAWDAELPDFIKRQLGRKAEETQ